MNYFERLSSDVRFLEGLNSCMNCGVCTAICPAAETYNYDPRVICNMVQTRDNAVIEDLLKSETIWYCGQCMSCRTRCPRGNTPGLLIQSLRSLSQELGFFTESEKGRQQLYIKRTVGQWILDYGYCVWGTNITIDRHPEQGPVWDWVLDNWNDIFEKTGGNYQKQGPGILRKIPDETLQELQRIFETTGGIDRFEKLEKYSELKAREMNLGFDDSLDNDYIKQISQITDKNHFHE